MIATKITYRISDMGEAHLQTLEGNWAPLHTAQRSELIGFDTEAEAIAFCAGYRAAGRFCKVFVEDWR